MQEKVISYIISVVVIGLSVVGLSYILFGPLPTHACSVFDSCLPLEQNSGFGFDFSAGLGFYGSGSNGGCNSQCGTPVQNNNVCSNCNGGGYNSPIYPSLTYVKYPDRAPSYPNYSNDYHPVIYPSLTYVPYPPRVPAQPNPANDYHPVVYNSGPAYVPAPQRQPYTGSQYSGNYYSPVYDTPVYVPAGSKYTAPVVYQNPQQNYSNGTYSNGNNYGSNNGGFVMGGGNSSNGNGGGFVRTN